MSPESVDIVLSSIKSVAKGVVVLLLKCCDFLKVLLKLSLLKSVAEMLPP